jgi:hypothetical protein
MSCRTLTGPVRRWLTDFLAAFILFWAAVLFIGGSNGHAFAARPLPKLQPGVTPPSVISLLPRASDLLPPHRGGDRSKRASLLILSLSFSSLVALNLAFWRHLRRVYAFPRRRPDGDAAA